MITINIFDFEKYFRDDNIYRKTLYFIFIVATALRIYRVCITGPVSFDEAYSTWVGSKSLLSLFAIAAMDKHPPLYYLIMHFWNFFGYSETWIRIPSLMASVLSLYIFIKVSASVLKSRLAVISAFFLFAVDISQIQYASIARSYAIDSLFVLLSVYAFFKILQGNYAKKWLRLNLLSNILLILLTYTGGFVFLAQALIITWMYFFDSEKRKSVNHWVKYHLLVILICLVLTPYIYNQLSVGGFAPKWIAEVVGKPWLELLYFQGTLLNLELFNIESLQFRLLLGSLIALVIFLSSFSIKDKFKINRDLQFWTLILIYSFPPIVFWLISKIEPIFVSRYFLIFYFAYYILLTYALYNIRYVKRIAPIVTLFFIFGVISLFKGVFSDFYKESDWPAKSAVIASNWQKNDVIFVIPHADGLRVKFYLRNMDKYKIDLNIYRDIFRSKTKQVTTAVLDSTFNNWKYPYKRIWFHEEKGTGLAAEFEVVQTEGFIYSYLDSVFTHDQKYDFEDDRGKLSLFEIKK